MIKKRTKGLAIAVVALVAMGLGFSSPAHASATAGSIAGTLTDNGAPVEGASVQVSTYEYVDDGYSGYATTDAAGHYQLTDVPAGSYRMSFQAPGHPMQYAIGKATYEEASPITVVADAETTVDDSLLPTGTINGRFTDAAGNGVSAYVSAVGGSNSNYYWTSDGSYSLAVLAGTYRVQFQTSVATQYAYGARYYGDGTEFTVAAGQTVTVNDTQLATGSIAGHVANADGTPAAGIDISAQGDNYGYSSTDGDGNYRIDGLAPGSYRLQFRLPSGATEWAHGKFRFSQAEIFEVSADAVTTVDETLPPTGSVAGRFLDPSGSGAAYLSVDLSSGEQNLSGSTDADGNFRIDGVFGGTYIVAFANWETNLHQFAYGKVDGSTADKITVTPGQTTTVNDTQLPSGTVRIVAKDALTGATIPAFFVGLGNHYGDTSSGELILSDNVLVGTYQLSAGADGYKYLDNAATVTVTAGQQTEVTVTLTPKAKITTTLVDAKTGAPVAGMCVIAEKLQGFDFPDGCGDNRSDSAGKVTVSIDNPGLYQLFVLPPRNSVYGAQWVGWTGGKGDQALARIISTSAGKTTTVPSIKMDKTGTITGKVLTSAGQPVVNGFVGVVGPDLGAGSDRRYSEVAADGTYSVDWLGPYQWPLFFGGDHQAMQWSGGVGNRLLAQRIKVKAGSTVTYNTTLRQGAQVTVNLPGLGPDSSGRVVVRNAVTGDPMAVGDAYDGATSVDLLVIGPQYVKIQCYCGNGTVWYGGTDLKTATPVFIPAAGTRVINFPVG